MLKLTKTGIGLLTKQYRSVLRKCWAINVGIFATTALLTSLASNEAKADGYLYDSVTDGRTVTGYSINTGGAGYIIAADIDKMYANFVNNTSRHVGGALYMTKGISHVIGNYWGNAAATGGGAIYGGSQSFGTINANFIGNTARSGGAITGTSHIGTLNGSFVNNQATDGPGGAINTGANITNLTADFINNSATSYGGGMAIIGTITNLNSDFKGNTAGTSGGGIYSSGAITTLSADFIGNSSTSHGGGIYNEGTITSLSGTFRDNVSNAAGGAIWNGENSGNSLITTLTADFKENIASSSTSNVWGGGIGNSGGTISSITGDFINNSAVSTAAGANGYAIGGAVYNSEGTITSITGDFKGNKVEALSGSGNYGHEGSHGGAIANYVYGTSGTSHIGTIKGNFEDNTVTGAVWETGGAISNYAERSDSSTSGTILLQIDLIEGNFKNNSVVSTTNFTGVMGGAISNFAVGNNTSTIITKIKGNFEGNSTVNGGAIYNRSDDGTATISSIVGDFINNTASRDGGALVNYGTGATINSITGNFISNTATRKGGAIYNTGSVGLKADTQDILFYNNTSGTGENITYNDIYNQGTVNLNASGDHKISFGGSIDGASGTVNINTDNLQGGTYVFNNKVQNQSINIGSSTATNATTVRMGKITQTDGSESTGQLDNITSLTNYAVNSIFDTQNNTIETQNITTLYLANAMKLYIDAKLSGDGNTADTINATNVYSGSSGTEAPVAGSLIIDKINLIDTTYDDSGKTAEIVVAEEDSDLAQAYTVSDNVLKNNNMNYYTKVDYDNGKIIFSDKLINESGFYENLGSWSDGHYILNSTSVSNSADASHLTVGQALSALDEQLYNYYYTKTEADARYALLDTIGDVDYSDEAEDEGSALKNGEEDSPTTVRGALDLLDTKIGDLNETGIAGNDVATQLKYILENGSTGGAGVTLSTLGYIGANTPYLNTTNEAMNFSSTYTIGGNMSTLANQIKTNETNISNLSSRVNLLGSYSNGSADISENYAKVIGNTSIVTNIDNLKNDGNIVKAYATLATLNNKSYTVEIATNMGYADDSMRYYRIQVAAPSQEEAVAKAKNMIANNGWSYAAINDPTIGDQRFVNKYMYATDGYGQPVGYSPSHVDAEKNAIQSTNDVTVTENNYTVQFHSNEYPIYVFTMDVSASSENEAFTKAKELMSESWFVNPGGSYNNLYINKNPGSVPEHSAWQSVSLDSSATITEGSKGTSESYALGAHTIIENIALLDQAIGDLSATGVSGNSVAAQLQLLGEVGSEALGQKIGSWSTTKNSISQTLGEETKNYGYLTAFEYDSENEQYVGTVGDNLQALDSALSLTAKGLDALSYDLYNYYYTFRVDERAEVIEFAKELRNNKKEMSSLDFMPIKSSSDLRINLIKAEDPLTFSAKTRDDSLVLMEVCHA